MKIKSNYVLKKVADSYVVISLGGSRVDLNTIITLNETGAFIWEQIKNGADKDTVVDAILAEYDVGREKAEADVDAFCEKISAAGLVE